MKTSIRKILRRIWVIAGLSFFGWMVYSMQAKGILEQILKSDRDISVSANDYSITFTPSNSFSKVIIFYPGALVQTEAYAPLCRKLADNGYEVVLMKMPYRMANQGYEIIKEENLLSNPNKQYILAGHSQGGKMAAQFVYENPGLIDKLILLGTSHPRDYDMSEYDIPVLKLYGSNDGVASPADVRKNKSKLPSSAKFIEIKGGNHSQFGYYGFQFNDDKATIGREEQQEVILKNILNFVD
ncbi:MAG: alpha/beta hydrolase [Spirosomaceae bacterium]|nr:alpha/beta hydrolase [Spirosomataceae bacterium]MDP5140454.1 alpha/beta hydrolase [Spirosomataceae bacterium]